MPIINLKVDDETKAAIDARAAEENRTLRAVMLRALEAYLEENKDVLA